MKNLLNKICIERPVGTANNNKINAYLEEELSSLGYEVKSLPFDCICWESGKSQLSTAGEVLTIMPSPYSEGVTGEGKLVFADTVDNLKQLDCKDCILVLGGELAKEPLQPKDYPFYYPDEHKLIIDLLEEKSPKAIVALTDNDPMCGLSPFPLFDDGNFKIPSAYLSISNTEAVKKNLGMVTAISIVSSNKEVKSRQVVATKYGNNRDKKVVVCAHMDTKYHTPGALDNAAGVAVLMETAAKLVPVDYSIDIVPFNGEEYFAASGEMMYLQSLQEKGEKVSLLVNIDAPCHIGADTSVSFYNLGDKQKDSAVKLFEKYPTVCEGEPWYAGDHCAFVFAGTPGIAVSSSDIFTGGLAYTHGPNDVIDCIDINSVSKAASYLAELIQNFEA